MFEHTLEATDLLEYEERIQGQDYGIRVREIRLIPSNKVSQGISVRR
jgi:hypothetical protein